MLSFSKALRVELCRRNIRVMAVCPGWIQTEFFSHAIHDDTVSYFNRYYGPKEVIEKAVRDMHRNKPVSILGVPKRQLPNRKSRLSQVRLRKVWRAYVVPLRLSVRQLAPLSSIQVEPSLLSAVLRLFPMLLSLLLMAVSP